MKNFYEIFSVLEKARFLLHRRKIAMCFCLVFFSVFARLHFLLPGFGSDPDAWRMANTGRNLFKFLIYAPSRPPSYPLVEFLHGALAFVHQWGMNYATVLISAITVVALYLIAKSLNLKHALILSLAFSFNPLFFVSSLNAMDYVWSLFFMLFAVYFAVEKRPIASFIQLALATASRFTSAVFFPLIVYLLSDEFWKNKKAVLSGIFIYLMLVILFYLPAALVLGVKNLFSGAIFSVATTEIWKKIVLVFEAFATPLALLSLILLLLLIYANRNESNKRKFLIFSFLSVAFTLSIFLKYPYEAAYLLPAVPFTVLTFGFLNRKELAVALLVLSLAGCFLSIDFQPEKGAVLTKGFVLRDAEARQNYYRNCRKISEKVLRYKDSAFVVFYYEPGVKYFLEDIEDWGRVFYLPDKKTFELVKQMHSEIYYLNSVRPLILQKYCYDIYLKGGKPLSTLSK